jgi:uncharacterized protein YjiS (DUF1127 family)
MRRITRSQAMQEIRDQLLKLVDDEHSMCDVAARYHIFCGGFARWTFTELKQRYPQIVRSRPRITPAELRELANRWQLARQLVKGTELACDTQMIEAGKRTCQGWDEFTDEQLAGFHASLCHEDVEIVPDAERGEAAPAD